MKRITAAAAAVLVLALPACGGGPPQPSVSECTKEIVAHPVNGPWPGCKGLSQADLWKATVAAMAQGAKG